MHVINDVSQGGRSAVEPATLVELLERRAEETLQEGLQEGSATPVYTFLGEGGLELCSLTAVQLAQWARAVASFLTGRIRPGDRVLILIPPGPDYVRLLAAFFGCLYAGAVAVPVPPPQRRRALPRVMSIVRDCRPSLVLTTGEILATLGRPQKDGDDAAAAAQAELGALEFVAMEEIPAEPTDWRPPALDEASVAFLQYTSGSTGAPKGVVLSHGNLLHNQRLIARTFAQTQASVIVGWLPPYHDMGLIGNLLQPLYLGARSVHMAPQDFLLQPRRWLEAISHYRGTASGGPNFAYDLCVDKIAPEQRKGLDLSSWTLAFNGAEPIRATTLDRFAEAFAEVGFNRSAFFPCYGLAEATLLVSGRAPDAAPVVTTVDRKALEQGLWRPSSGATGSGAEHLVLVGSGRPAAGQQVVIVDPATLAPCREGDVGEIWVKGPSVALGYWDNPEETAATFAARLATGEGPFLRTGDLGVMAAGELTITGRQKDLIIVRGRNIYPQDIEQTAGESHDVLRARTLRAGSAAFSVEPEGSESLIVVQELSRPPSLDLEEVREAITRAIADRHEVAVHDVVFIKAGTLPRTTSGKVQRRACREQFLNGSLARLEPIVRHAPPRPREVPQTDTEKALAEIWQEVLGRTGLGRDQEFLSLGGDSLRAMQVVARVQQRWRIEAHATQAFETTTIAAFAAWIDARLGETQVRTREEIAVAPRPARLPLTFVQERLWFLEQLVAPAPVYHIAVALRLRGRLDHDALEAAVNALSVRHEALRTRFPLVDGQVVQEVVPDMRVTLPVRGLDDGQENREGALAEARAAEAREPFALGLAPPVRWTLVGVEDREHVLLFVCHHLIADAWSVSVLVRELGALYRGFASGQPAELPLLPTSYAEHAIRERQRHQAAGGRAPELQIARSLRYWQKKLAGSIPALQLPSLRPRPATRGYAGGRHEFALSPDIVQGLAALGREEGATLFMAMATGFFALLHRYSAEDDLCVGTPIAGRSRPGLDHVVGCFLNTLALRVDASGNPSVREFLRRVRAVILEAHAHDDVAFEKVLESLPIARDPSRTPLFDVMFSMQPPVPSLRLGGGEGDLGVDVVQLGTGTAQFDLALDVAPEGAGARAAFEYSTELFDDATVARMATHLTVLLASMVERPDVRLGALALLDERERAFVLRAPPSLEAAETCVHELFEERARLFPEAVAVVDGEERSSYRLINEQANRLARHLRSNGVGPESRVGVFLERSASVVVSALATLKAGAAYVPLDPHQPPERTAFMGADAELTVLVTTSALLGRLSRLGVKTVLLDEAAEGLAGARSDDLGLAVSPDQIAYINYTSGSTGRPKGVMVSHRSLAAACAAWRHVYDLPSTEVRLLQLASPAFDVWTADWVRALCSGGTLVLGTREAAVDPAVLTQLIEREAITVVDVVPALIRPLLRIWKGQGDGERQAASSLRLLIVGSDAWSVRDYVDLRRACPPHTRLMSCYGVTEATIDNAWFEGPPAVDLPLEASVPLGRGLPGTRLYVLDRHGEPAALGVPGELAIGGTGVARGYWKDACLTAERFVPDPFADHPGSRLYRTGDRARLRPDGTFEFLGRIDHQVKVRGLRIELREIEACLRRHPDIEDAVVTVAEAGGSKELVAYVVRAHDVGAEVLSRDLRRELPLAMIPSSFVFLERLPLSPSGKIDRKALPPPLREPEVAGAVGLPPATLLEKTIAAVWREVLPQGQFGVHDNFFDRGGHSLLLAQVATRLTEELGRPLPVLTLFENPTIATLAQALGDAPSAFSQPSSQPHDDVRVVNERRTAVLARRRSRAESVK